MGEQNFAVSIFEERHSLTPLLARVKCLLHVHQGFYKRQIKELYPQVIHVLAEN